MSELHDEAADIRPSTTSGIRLPRTSAIPRALIILLGAAAAVITVAGVPPWRGWWGRSSWR